MKLQVITYPEPIDGEVGIISSLLEEFKFTLHLRKPAWSEEDYLGFLSQLDYKWYQRIVVHNHKALQQRFCLKGTHYPGTSNVLSDPDYSGRSCHSISELSEYDAGFSYQYISPVFQSISKPEYKGDLNLQTLKDFLGNSRKSEIYALGGVDVTKIVELQKVGFDGVAVLGSIWGNGAMKEKDYTYNLERIYKCLN